MSSIKKWVVSVAAGAAACGSVGAFAADPVFSIGRQSQAVQTPTTAGESGISYEQTGALTSSVKVYTEGFLFCGNAPASSGSGAGGANVALVPRHEDQSFTPAHPWTFATTNDIAGVGFTGNGLALVPGGTVTCLGTAVDGAVGSGLSEGVFDNGYDSAASENFRHLVNWNPAQGFDWSAPDWTQVPADPCHPAASESPRAVEDVACAAATGLRPAAGTAEGSVRAPTMWTATDGVSFTYLFRVDVRFGPQTSAAPSFATPVVQSADETDGGVPMQVVVEDAFDASYLQASGQWCVLSQLPATLNSGACGASSSELTGALSKVFQIAPPPLGGGLDQTFYVVVIRPIGAASHSNLATPVAAGAVLVDTAVTGEGGDRFTGDDVVFGFMPTSSGFPWMGAQ